MLKQKLQSWKLTAPPELISFIAEKCLKNPIAALQTLRLRCLPQTELPGPEVAAYVPQAIWMEMGFSIGFTAAANIIHARQGAASTLIALPSDPAGN